MKKWLTVISFSVLLLAQASILDAFAINSLRITTEDAGGNIDSITIADNSIMDSEPLIDGLIFSILNGFGCADISITATMTKPEIGSSVFPVMDLLFDSASSEECHIDIEFSDTGFVTSGNIAIISVIDGETSGNVQYKVFFDPANGIFEQTNLLFDTGILSPTNPPLNLDFSGNGQGGVSNSGDYSITMLVTLWHSNVQGQTSAEATLVGEETAIGGTLLPIDSFALLVAGVQSTTWMIPVLASIVGIGLFLLRRDRN